MDLSCFVTKFGAPSWSQVGPSWRYVGLLGASWGSSWRPWAPSWFQDAPKAAPEPPRPLPDLNFQRFCIHFWKDFRRFFIVFLFFLIIFLSSKSFRAVLQRSRSARWRLCARSALDIRRPRVAGGRACVNRVTSSYQFSLMVLGGPQRALRWQRQVPRRPHLHFFDSSWQS